MRKVKPVQVPVSRENKYKPRRSYKYAYLFLRVPASSKMIKLAMREMDRLQLTTPEFTQLLLAKYFDKI